MHRLIRIAGVGALLCALSAATAADAATLEPVGEFQQPVSVTSDPSNAGRLLVGERDGTVDEVVRGAVTQIADLSSLVSCCKSERGLLSIVPAPDFGSSGRFYAAYTGTPTAGGAKGDVHVDSFHPDPGGGALIREPILSVGHAEDENHNGGQLQFGPDGHLYISLGDGGGVGDPADNAQNTEVLLGKILRIDPQPGQAPAYAVPPDNPFVGKPGRDEIWAYGLRNPWRFSFDRAGADMVIGDVGQGSREEVDYARSPGGGVVAGAGANYGWNCREGFIAYSAPGASCAAAGSFSEPVFDYVHQNPADGAAFGCSVIGGYVVRDPSLTELYGRYLYADYCVGQIRSLVLPSSSDGLASDDRHESLVVPEPSSFGEDACGRLYVASGEGTVYRFVGATSAACSPVATAPSATARVAGNHQRLRLRLRARSRGARLTITAWAVPCSGDAGDRVQLNRGGKRLGSKRLNTACIARFFTRFDGAATFRALLPGDETIRSRRLTVRSHPPDAG